MKKAVVWLRIGFDADPIPGLVFYPDPGSQTYVDPCYPDPDPSQNFIVTKKRKNFFGEKYFESR
jgi:hypothetical protein